MSATPCHLYYDLEVANQSLQDTSAPPSELSFTEVRSSAVLANPNDYFMSIVRFSVDTAGSLPIFIPQIDLAQPVIGNPNFPNKTIYNISFNYLDAASAVPAIAAGITTTRNVIYKPHSTQKGINSQTQFNPPTAPLTINKCTENYYWVQSFYAWINMLNETLSDAWADLVTAVGAAVAPAANPIVAPYTNPPYMTWDSETNKAIIWVPEALFNQGYDWDPSADPLVTPQPFLCTLSFNAPLHILFSSFEYVFNSYEPPQAFIIRCYDRRNVGYSAASNLQAVAPLYKPPNPAALLANWTTGGLAMEQLYSTGPTMSAVTSLLFTTSLLPVLPSLIGLPRIFVGASTGNSAQQQQGNNNIQNQITDLEVPLTRGDEYLPNVLYSPVAEYRLLDLQSNSPLQAIQISVFWKDIFGQTHPFYLQNGCGATLKVMFRKKAYNNIVPFS